MSGRRRYEGDPGPLVTSAEVRALTEELHLLRKAFDENKQELLNGMQMARFLGVAPPTFRTYVASGAITPIYIDDDAPARYSRSQAMKLIEEKAEASQ